MHLDPTIIASAAERLREGGLVAFPTETVYGLGADALNNDAVARVFSLKGRPATNPLIVHVADESAARALATGWPDDAHRLAAAFWPGPLTIVVPCSPRVPPAVTAGGPTVAIRSPDHPVALALLAAFGSPIVGPSANPAGGVSPTCAAHVLAAFPGLMVLDGGPCRIGVESTVIELTPRPRILRLGIITAAVITEVLHRPVGYAPATDPEGPASSPGHQSTHYAPAAAAILVHPDQVPALLASDQPVALLARRDIEVRPPHRLIRMPTTAAAYAATLYAALRAADAGHPALIAIERPPADSNEPELWRTVADRLSPRTASPP